MAAAKPDFPPKDHRLSPRCLFNGSMSPGGSSYMSASGASPFGLSRQSSVTSAPQHGRQGSIHSATSAELSQYLSPHSRQSSSSASMSPLAKGCPPLLPPRCVPKLSPTSLDMGYHTMVTHGHDEDSPPSRFIPPPNVMKPKPPDVPSVLQMDAGKQTVVFRKMRPFEWLTDELILEIMSHLPTNSLCVCARVCRRFYFLAWEPRLWTHISLNVKEAADKALDTLLKLLSRDSQVSQVCSAVEKLTLNNCARLTDAGMAVVSQKCPELRVLEMRNCKEVTNVGVQAVATKCTSLCHLDLAGCSLISTVNLETPEPSPMTAALGGVPPAPTRTLYLQYLDLSDCTRLIDAGLQVVAKNTPHLHHLYLRRCVNVTDIGIKHLTSYCLNLRELSISDCIQITDFGLYELAKLGPNLRYLSVAKCDQISDAGVKQIARLCYKLRYLNVRGCEAVSDDAVSTLAKSCLRLRSLDIGKCDVTDVGLKLLAEHCPSLRKLSVKSCEMISDQGLQCVAYHCRGLQQLNIQDCSVSVEAYRTVKKFCKRCIIEHTNPGFF